MPASIDQEMFVRRRIRRCSGNHLVSAKKSRREALVSIMQPADLRDGDDIPDLARLYRPLFRAILVQGEMCPSAVVVIHVR